MTVAQWFRKKLLEASQRGIVPADLFSELKSMRKSHTLGSITYNGGRVHSMYRQFRCLAQLGWIKRTGIREQSTSKGGDTRLIVNRTYFAITPKGRLTPEQLWSNPLIILYPDWAASGDRKQAYMRAWRLAHKSQQGPGRPRKKTLKEWFEEEDKYEEAYHQKVEAKQVHVDAMIVKRKAGGVGRPKKESIVEEDEEEESVLEEDEEEE